MLKKSHVYSTTLYVQIVDNQPTPCKLSPHSGYAARAFHFFSRSSPFAAANATTADHSEAALEVPPTVSPTVFGRFAFFTQKYHH